jgi:hypothetical protein
MTLLWLLCVCLVLGGLVFRQEVRAALEGLRLRLFGVPVRVRRLPAQPTPDTSPDRRQDFFPPPHVITRAGP